MVDNTECAGKASLGEGRGGVAERTGTVWGPGQRGKCLLTSDQSLELPQPISAPAAAPAPPLPLHQPLLTPEGQLSS